MVWRRSCFGDSRRNQAAKAQQQAGLPFSAHLGWPNLQVHASWLSLYARAVFGSHCCQGSLNWALSEGSTGLRNLSFFAIKYGCKIVHSQTVVVCICLLQANGTKPLSSFSFLSVIRRKRSCALFFPVLVIGTLAELVGIFHWLQWQRFSLPFPRFE